MSLISIFMPESVHAHYCAIWAPVNDWHLGTTAIVDAISDCQSFNGMTLHVIWLGNSPGFNSLWPSDAIWWHRLRSTLVHVMACCLTATSHYLNKCWLIISHIFWHSHDVNFTANMQNRYLWYEFKKYQLKVTTTRVNGLANLDSKNNVWDDKLFVHSCESYCDSFSFVLKQQDE